MKKDREERKRRMKKDSTFVFFGAPIVSPFPVDVDRACTKV
jgi:hypothetical protein